MYFCWAHYQRLRPIFEQSLRPKSRAHSTCFSPEDSCHLLRPNTTAANGPQGSRPTHPSRRASSPVRPDPARLVSSPTRIPRHNSFLSRTPIYRLAGARAKFAWPMHALIVTALHELQSQPAHRTSKGHVRISGLSPHVTSNTAPAGAPHPWSAWTPCTRLL